MGSRAFLTRHLVRVGAIAITIVIAALIAAGGDEQSESDPAGPVRAEVKRIVDGDTVVVELSGEEERVRYIGIDTPESAIPGEPTECYGAEAGKANARLVDGRTVELRFDAERRDRYGRLLAYVYEDGTFVNARLVALGFARTLEIAPNTAHAELFARVEAEAGRGGLGLWSAC